MSIVKKTGILLLSEVIAKGVAFMLIPLYSFLILPDDFGKIAILQIFFTAFQILVSFSLKSTFDKYFFDSKEKSINTLFSNLIVLQFITLVLGGLVYLIFLRFFASLLNIGNNQYFDIVFVTTVLAVFLPIVNSYLLCIGDVNKVGKYSIVISVVRSVIALVLVLNMEDKILAVLLANLVEHLLGALIAAPFYIKRISSKHIRVHTIKEMGVYSLLYFPAIVSNFLIKFSDRLMIQFMLGYQSLGIYAMGTRLVNIPGQFISTINKNFTPQIYQSISEDNILDFNKLVRFFLVSIFVLLFGLILFSKEVFYLIGDEYQSSYAIFIILSYTSYINGYNLMIQPSMTYYKKYVKYKSIIFVSIGIINIIFNFLVIPKYGITGAALVTAVSYLASIPFSYHYSRMAYKANYFIKWFYLSCVLLAGISLYMIISVDESSIFEFCVRIISFLGIGYLFVVRLANLKNLYSKLSFFVKVKLISKDTERHKKD
ncbi:oligosaccharide flippase family protein [Maribacter sp. MMG018]|uniref:lipopolysaccharide biosynthesis protein n=1 Tax=Maribacter sp. MMG018 TaxID=2822688 RepID=UPI001B383FF2|nr:oligosaccharide flippase family protein [Maribacter sp. MMG018]MBQ4913418.1 oligosaccharide flippase family protein [Maribacter sp. MMG018]